MNEAETRAEHIDPALAAAVWGVVEGSRIRPRHADRQIGTSTPAVLVNGVPGKSLPTAGGDPRWRTRGYLPHFDSPGVIQHITFHLADSVAKDVIRNLESALRFLPEPQRDTERRKRLEAWMDAGHGSCLLRDPAIARMMQASLLYSDGHRYRLFAWVVMPNHVHVLVEPLNPWTIAKIVATWKKFAARQINDNLRAAAKAPLNPFWHREYWDRFIRDARHFQHTLAYIHNNPVTAGLAASPEHWPWSSAFPGNAEHQFGKPKTADPPIGAPRKP